MGLLPCTMTMTMICVLYVYTIQWYLTTLSRVFLQHLSICSMSKVYMKVNSITCKWFMRQFQQNQSKIDRNQATPSRWLHPRLDPKPHINKSDKLGEGWEILQLLGRRRSVPFMLSTAMDYTHGRRIRTIWTWHSHIHNNHTKKTNINKKNVNILRPSHNISYIIILGQIRILHPRNRAVMGLLPFTNPSPSYWTPKMVQNNDCSQHPSYNRGKLAEDRGKNTNCSPVCGHDFPWVVNAGEFPHMPPQLRGKVTPTSSPIVNAARKCKCSKETNLQDTMRPQVTPMVSN